MHKLLLIITLSLITSLSFSASEWELKKDENGIKVYVRSVEGSSFKEYKGETVIHNTTVKDVLNIIFDVKNYDKLFPDVSGQKLLKQIGEYHNIHYIIIHTPWPISNRDNVTELNASLSDDGKSATVTINALPDYIPAEKGLVRVKGKGTWQLKETGNGDVNVVYQYHGSPGGSVPAWLANSFVVSHPFETLENLHKRVDK